MIIFADNVFGNTGYAHAVRSLAYWMSKKTEVAIKDNYKPLYCPDYIYPLIKPDIDVTGQTVIYRPMFDRLDKYLSAKRIIANVVLEGLLPERVIPELNDDRVEQVWCPSSWCRDNYIKSGVVAEKIRIVPHGINTKLYKPLKVQKSDKFTFLFVGGYCGRGDRKGADLLVEAFDKAFKPEDKVRLYLKINKSYSPDFDAVSDLLSIPKQNLDITVDTKDYKEEEMPYIYNLGDVFVSPSMGEGFNMTVLEAMACGVPALTFNNGGHLDFCNPAWCNTETVKVPAKYSNLDAQSVWQKPDVESLSKHLNWVFNRLSSGSYEEHRKKDIRNAKKFTWEFSSEIAIKYLNI